MKRKQLSLCGSLCTHSTYLVKVKEMWFWIRVTTRSGAQTMHAVLRLRDNLNGHVDLQTKTYRPHC
jgi:hypothetical protein